MPGKWPKTSGRTRRALPAAGALGLLLGALALPTGTAHAGEAERVVDRLPVLAGTEHIEHFSPRLGRNFQIFIKRSDAARPDAGPLPIVYLLDADQAFPLIASYSWALTFSGEMPPSIIVGIGYGSTAPAANFRGTDYTVPSDRRADAGGADIFLEVLEKEIFPLVEARIEGDPDRRTLMGQSLGGHFVLHQAIERPGLVALGIAVNPAIHNSPDHFYRALERLDAAPTGQALYIASADGDAERYRLPALEFYARMDRHPGLPWCLRVEQLDDHTHLTSMPRAFRQAMRWHGRQAPHCGEIDPLLLEATGEGER